MSPSDDLPYWTSEEIRDTEYDYAELLERLEFKYHLNDYSFDADDMEYPPDWEPGL